MLIYCNFVFLVNFYLIIAFSVGVFCYTSVLSANCIATENLQYFGGFCIMGFVSQSTFELLICFHSDFLQFTASQISRAFFFGQLREPETCVRVLLILLKKYYASINSKGTHPMPPPGQHPGHLNFCKNLSNPLICGQATQSSAPLSGY